MRIMMLTISAALLSGCRTSGGVREIRSTPSGAFVAIDGFGECETPCTVKLDEPRRIRVAKAGYITQDFILEPKGGAIDIPLELAAASTEVDATSLPDLE